MEATGIQLSETKKDLMYLSDKKRLIGI